MYYTVYNYKKSIFLLDIIIKIMYIFNIIKTKRKKGCFYGSY